jgi:phosphonoacetate hydrolase
MSNKVVIFVFDGLRPDMVDPATMPNLHRFGQAGTRFTGSRVAFPSETRVNQATLVTGCWPAKHGIVGNRFMDQAAYGGNLINSGDEDALRMASDALAGKLLDVDSLGELLAARGMSLAVTGSGTAGGTRILNHRAEDLGQFRLSLYRPDASTPSEDVAALTERLGPIPEAVVPANDRTTYLVDAFLNYVMPELAPDVSIVWSFEPDISYHYSGLGTPDNRSALQCADAEFARVLAWRDAFPSAERPTIITLSDHGHLSIEGQALDVMGKMRSAGFDVAKSLDDGADAALFCQRAGGIYVRDSAPALVASMTAWLVEQPWCELVFTKDQPQTLTLAEAGIEHRRAPDIAFVTSSHDGLSEFGLPGRCAHDAPDLAPEGGLHGGMHPVELGNWFAVQGPAFATYREIDTPCGIVDVLPTVLHVLGLTPPPGIDGRVLAEALGEEVLEEESVQRLTSSAGSMTLERSQFRNKTYLERGGRLRGEAS